MRNDKKRLEVEACAFLSGCHMHASQDNGSFQDAGRNLMDDVQSWSSVLSA